MFRRVMGFCVVLLALTTAASAAPTLVYEGSFDLPSASAWSDYYYGKLAFVPDGTPRPGNAQSVTGPTIVAKTTWAGKTREFNNLPAPSKNPASVGTATLVTYANGGTEYNGDCPSVVDSAGNFWTGVTDTISTNPGIRSNPDDGDPLTEDHVLGNDNSGSPAVQESGWYIGPGGSNYPNGGTLRRGDAAGGDLPTDGTAIGAVFLTSAHLSGGSPQGYKIYVAQNVRTSATTVSGTLLFKAYQSSFNDGKRPVEYVRDTAGDEWFLLYLPGAHTGDSFTLDFFDGTIADGAEHDPTFSVDIGPDIAAGAGWLDADGGTDSQIKFISVDWANSQLYVLDGGVYGSARNREARVHVFTLQGEGGGAVPEPGALGLMGLALLGLRKKRR